MTMRSGGLSAALGSLPADAAFMTGRLERPSGGAESFAPHVPQGKGLLLYGLCLRLFRGMMRK